MELTLLYVHGTAIGYGRYGTLLAAALEQVGVDVYDHLDGPDQPQNINHQLLEEGRRAKKTNTVCWISTPSHARGWWEGQHAAISTMWETTYLPESFRQNLHEFDTVIVPSMQNVDLFGGYHPNVQLCLLGVDPARWHYTPRRDPGPYFDFLIGGSGPRKGTDLAFAAFQRLWGQDGSWGDGPIPRLVMKNPKNEGFHGPRVEMIAGRLSDDEEVAVYENAHCYLQPSRGEGFGLQPLQALAQGIPTILTDAHGHESFAHLGHPVTAGLSKAAYFIYGDAGEWWEPSLDELCDQMLEVYHHYPEALAKARRSAAEIAAGWTWRNTAERFARILGEPMSVGYDGPGRWHEPQSRRYLVITNRDWTADIGGTLYYFKQGEQYWEPADVKRILFEAERLDPACLAQAKFGADAGWMDVGLTRAQYERIPRYTAAHEHCPTCHQRLNSGPTRSDEIFAELETAANAR